MKIIILAISVLFLPNLSPYFQNDELSSSIGKGKLLYQDFCITCHLPNGMGTKSVVPPLANSDFLIKNRSESIRSVKYGQKGNIMVNGIAYNGLMPAPGLDDDEVVDVLNYITHSWGNDLPIFTEKEIKTIKK
ncbi:MAG: cytochrome c [Saprospiraceae bacterium]|nr:cytochrome c [Saprospiraceae bacterium]